jgi:hypothetical protein
LIRLSKIHEYIIYLISVIVIISGFLWLYFDFFVRIETEFSLQVHPMQNIFLILHGSSSIIFLIILGSVLPMHVYKAWKTKNNRLSGGFFLLLFTILILTGIGLFYSGVEYNRRLLSVLHWVIGILFPIFFVIHIYFGKFKR